MLARIQPFCKPNKVDMGYFNGEEIRPRLMKERNKALYENPFCSIRKWEGVGFNKAIQQLKSKFAIVNN